ncbi:hypothetical protein P775_10030 [Puniceibacterium antarcticum]|uniref:Periplasmic heavy metal sensor n=1 Tax=Puniceibacterium antarcticum TaxID=1206336 RepID=A0A2G8RFG4_9RHOB|nr:periplasmic heavy metal sensor [Puniceibacterium antarcticum]PIL20279.1 hypothetical protein P775_10030 [Puniceibacterium antarcticum]
MDLGKTRWLRGGLIVSLALNLALVGAIGGFALIGGRHDQDARGKGGPEGMPYIRALSEGDRADMRDALRRDFRDHRDARGQVTEDYRAAVAALRAEPFDQSALMTVLERQSERAQKRFLGGQRVMVDFVANMTPEDRAAYAQRLSDQIDRLDKRWGRLDRE